jgi:hypothetical protein
MFGRFLTILVALATVVAGVYAVIAYHFPNDRKAEDGAVNQTRPVVTSRDPTRPGVQIINQESRASNSPNIIGDRNVVNSR